MIGGPMGENDQPKGAVSQAIVATGQVAGALIGAVGVVYVLGGAIIWARMALGANAQITVVAGLPRETVTSAGLGAVVFSILVGAVYGLVRLVHGRSRFAPPQWWQTLIHGLLLLTPTLVTVGVSLGVNRRFRNHVEIGEIIFLGAAFVLVWPYAWWVGARAWKALAEAQGDRYRSKSAVAQRAGALAAIVLPWLMIAAVSLPPPLARVCTAGTTAGGTRHVDGTLIGETTERAYVTDTTAERIVSIPKAEVTRVYIGNDADAATSQCPTPKGSAPSSP
jgi:hypothetical protein